MFYINYSKSINGSKPVLQGFLVMVKTNAPLKDWSSYCTRYGTVISTVGASACRLPRRPGRWSSYCTSTVRYSN